MSRNPFAAIVLVVHSLRSPRRNTAANHRATLLAALLAAAVVLTLATFLAPKPASAEVPGVWRPLVERLEADGFDRKAVHALFNRPGVQYDPRPMRMKLEELHGAITRSGRVRAVQRGLAQLGYDPGKADGRYGPNTDAAIRRFQQEHELPVNGLATRETRDAVEDALMARGLSDGSRGWSSRVYEVASSTRRLAEARDFYFLQRPAFAAMERDYGVDAAVVGGVISVETRSGHYLGSRKAFVTLASMALAKDFQQAKRLVNTETMPANILAWLKETSATRADWAYNELASLIRYAELACHDPLEIPGSVYGAVGIAQFMPSNIAKHGADGDGDGVINLFDPQDAIHSAGSYLKDYGWTPQTGSALPEKRRVLYGYNHSQRYVNTVIAVADHLAALDRRAPRVMPRQHRVIVRDSVELVQALAPGVRVVLAPGDYDLAAAAGTASPHVRWETHGGRPTAVIHSLVNATIEAAPGDVARLMAPAAPGAPALILDGVRSFELRNVEVLPAWACVAPAPGEPEPEPLAGTVEPHGRGLVIRNAEQLQLVECRFQLLGEGALALTACKDVTLWGCHFSGNAGQVLAAASVQGLDILDTYFTANTAAQLIALAQCADVALRWCGLLDNSLEKNETFTGAAALIAIEGTAPDHVLEDSVVWGNRAGVFCDRLNSLRRDGSVINKNRFARGLG